MFQELEIMIVTINNYIDMYIFEVINIYFQNPIANI